MEWGISGRRPKAPTQAAFDGVQTKHQNLNLYFLFPQISALFFFFACFMEGRSRAGDDGEMPVLVLYVEAFGEIGLRRRRRRSGIRRVMKSSGSSEDGKERSRPAFRIRAKQQRRPTFLSPAFLPPFLLFKVNHFLFLKFPLLMNFLPPVTLCLSSPPVAYKIETSFCCAPDRGKTVMLRLTCFATSQHISLMFAGSNLLHHNLLTESLNASLGDK